MCAYTHTQGIKNRHTPIWMSEKLLTKAAMITAHGKPPPPHFLFHLLQSPSSLPLLSPWYTNFPLCFQYFPPSSLSFLQLFFQLQPTCLVFYPPPSLLSFLSMSHPPSFLISLSSLFLTFLQLPAEEEQTKVSCIPFPLIQHKLPLWGHFLCCFDTLIVFRHTHPHTRLLFFAIQPPL